MQSDKPLVRIAIADDHQLFADGLEQLLSSIENYAVIGKVNDGKLLMRLLNASIPDLILMDINMPRMDGFETTREIRLLLPDIRIIFISMYYDPNIIAMCRQLKVNGYLTKDTTADVMKETILAVMGGETVYLSKANEKEPRSFFRNDAFIQQFKISPKELEIIRQIKAGNTSKAISANLSLSELTIETHRKNIFRKLNVRSMAELIRFAYEHNL